MVGCAVRTKIPASKNFHGAHGAPYLTGIGVRSDLWAEVNTEKFHQAPLISNEIKPYVFLYIAALALAMTGFLA